MTAIKSFLHLVGGSQETLVSNTCWVMHLGAKRRLLKIPRWWESMALQSLPKTQINRLEEMKICLNQRIQPSAAFAEKTAAFWSLTMARN